MEIGISYWFGYPSFPEERIGLLKQFGFNSVSLHWTNEYEAVTGRKEAIPQLLHDSGIEISSFHLSFEQSKLLWNRLASGVSYRHTIRQAIDDACSLNVPTIVMHTDGAEFSESRLHLLEEVLEAAEQKGITLCLENLQIEDHLGTILEYLGGNVPLCYDTGHANIRPCPFRVIDNHWIRYIHFHDNLGSGDLHMMPWEGTTDWNDKLTQINSLPCISAGILEIHGNLATREAAEHYLQNAANCLKALKYSLSYQIPPLMPR